jgi:hypothetical protein
VRSHFLFLVLPSLSSLFSCSLLLEFTLLSDVHGFSAHFLFLLLLLPPTMMNVVIFFVLKYDVMAIYLWMLACV